MNELIFEQYLIDAEIVDQQQLDSARAGFPDQPIVRALEEMQIIAEEPLFVKLAEYLNLEYINLLNVTPSLFAVRMIPPEFLKEHGIVPLFCDHDDFLIATSCPGEWETTEYLRFATNRNIIENLATHTQITELLQDLLEDSRGNLLDTTEAVLHRKQIDIKERVNPSSFLEFEVEDAVNAATTILNRLIKNAIYRNVSDMHIEPKKDRVAVRVRIDGELTLVSELTLTVGKAIVSRLKVLADMDISKTLEPQDGSFTVSTKKIIYDLRLSTVNTPYGEKVVIRFLNPNQANVQLEDLGLLPEVSRNLTELSLSPQGLIIITGPTGSGKNTTLCSIINSLKSEVGNIVSVEDPIEYQIEGVNQVAVHEKRGITFANVLRALLRQDPNVIYIGEIRDEETAKIACAAAQTGHMVFSTLHTNDSASAIVRLLNMGIDPHVLSDALTAVLAQRLTRKLCTDCRKPGTTTDAVRNVLSASGLTPPEMMYKPMGCLNCNHTGYRNRIAVTELLVIDDDIKNLIGNNPSSVDVMNVAIAKGMRTLWRTGLELVANGTTTIEELQRHVPKTEMARINEDFPNTILVVDDDLKILKMLTTALEGHAGTVVTASDGDYGYEAAIKQRPDFVLTDINMPRMDGFALCRKLRENPETADIPIIVMTGKGSTDEAECISLEIGVDDFIRKPLRPVLLLARIRAAYHRRMKMTGAGN